MKDNKPFRLPWEPKGGKNTNESSACRLKARKEWKMGSGSSHDDDFVQNFDNGNIDGVVDRIQQPPSLPGLPNGTTGSLSFHVGFTQNFLKHQNAESGLGLPRFKSIDY